VHGQVSCLEELPEGECWVHGQVSCCDQLSSLTVLTSGCRLRDLLFLDMSLECTARTALETLMPHYKTLITSCTSQPLVSVPANGSDVVQPTVPQALRVCVKLVHAAVENAAISAQQQNLVSVSKDLCSALKWLSVLSQTTGISPLLNDFNSLVIKFMKQFILST
jgi:hypothetical protein